MDFTEILLAGTLISGVIWLIDRLYWRPKRQAMIVQQAQQQQLTLDDHQLKKQGYYEPWVIEYARSFFPVFLLVFVLRSFVAEPFRIPSESMLPNLFAGDFILVNKFVYGLRFPVWYKKFYAVAEPARGDVLVFRYPVDPKINFIKRVIGLPGDVISYQNKELRINGQLADKILLTDADYPDGLTTRADVSHFSQSLATEPLIEIFERSPQGRQITEITVPADHYFVMGDNRDDSDDSRMWGFVPQDHLLGKAMFIWMSWDGEQNRIRFNRLGQRIA